MVPARLLGEGEVVILAVKPGGWFCLLTSMPILSLMVLLVALTLVARGTVMAAVPPESILLGCAAVAALRLLLGWFQWMGRLYVLTNLRIITVRGVLREEIFSCPLKEVAEVRLSTALAERVLAVGSMLFETTRPGALPDWVNVNYPAEVHQILADAVRRSRSGGGR